MGVGVGCGSVSVSVSVSESVKESSYLKRTRWIHSEEYRPKERMKRR